MQTTLHDKSNTLTFAEIIADTPAKRRYLAVGNFMSYWFLIVGGKELGELIARKPGSRSVLKVLDQDLESKKRIESAFRQAVIEEALGTKVIINPGSQPAGGGKDQQRTA